MLKQLLLTTAMIVSSTYGSDAQIIDEGLDSNAHNASITIAETAASTLDALNRIQSVFENPNATDDEINDAILKLSKVSTDFRLKIIDMGGDANKPSITFDITPPETKGVVITHTARILTPLVAMLSELAPEPSQINVNGLFSLFLMTGIIPDLTPELLEIYMSDNTLSFISACLASGDSNKKVSTLFLVSLLINSITDPIHIAKLQELLLNHYQLKLVG